MKLQTHDEWLKSDAVQKLSKEEKVECFLAVARLNRILYGKFILTDEEVYAIRNSPSYKYYNKVDNED